MKKFKDLFEGGQGSPAADYVRDIDDEDEIAGKGYKYRSKGEQDFADQHVTLSQKNGIDVGYPIHPDNKKIFTGDVLDRSTKPEVADGAKDEKGEKLPLKTYKDMFNTAPRKEPKGQGFKEDIDNDECILTEASISTGNLKLDDGNKVKVTPKIAQPVNKTLKALTKSNASKMIKTMKKSKPEFNKAVNFAQKVDQMDAI